MTYDRLEFRYLPSCLAIRRGEHVGATAATNRRFFGRLARLALMSLDETNAASTVKQSRWRTKREISGRLLARAKGTFVLGALTIHSSLREG